jgi:hypothetical protein
VADLAARRARVSQSLFLTDRATASLMELGDGDQGLRESVERSEMIYDGANAYVRVAYSWTGSSWLIPVVRAGCLTRCGPWTPCSVPAMMP